MSLITTHEEMVDWVELIHRSGISHITFTAGPPAAVHLIFVGKDRRKVFSFLRLFREKLEQLGTTQRKVLFFQALGTYESMACAIRRQDEERDDLISRDREMAMDMTAAITVDELEGGEFCLH